MYYIVTVNNEQNKNDHSKYEKEYKSNVQPNSNDTTTAPTKYPHPHILQFFI